jgi:5-methylcytosine-specific restriction endonuclease McrA
MQRFIDEGNNYGQCHARFRIAHATWVRAIQRGAIVARTSSGRGFPDAQKRYDWAAIQEHYDAGATVRACGKHFGFSLATWTKAVRRGAVKPRTGRWTTSEALAYSTSRVTIKRHLLKAGILHNRCDLCGLTTWRGRAISIQIDHINGVKNDHRLENLRMLCPNCHSQTDTFAAKNRKLKSDPSSSNGRTASSDVAYGGSSPSLGA